MTTLTSKRVRKRYRRPQPPAVRKPRILCIDDDPDIQTTLELRMREYDVQLEHAYYGMQGVVEAVKQTPDLIIMDLAMPNGDGEYLLDCLRQNADTASIPVIVLTGMRDPRRRRSVLRKGANAYIQKPVAFQDLLGCMRGFIDF